MDKKFISVTDLSKDDILSLLEDAAKFEQNPNQRLLEGKVVATLFFEPSTRTRLSFETAANRLGARVIGFSDPNATSTSKGETLKDTIKMVSNYADVIVMRHYLEGAARYASEVTNVPIINAGDGANQHPSQTMLDLYSIWKTQGTLQDIDITMVGDLKYGRTVHSLLMSMRKYNPTFHFISPKELEMPEEYKFYCKHNDVKYIEQTGDAIDAVVSQRLLQNLLKVTVYEYQNDDSILKSFEQKYCLYPPFQPMFKADTLKYLFQNMHENTIYEIKRLMGLRFDSPAVKEIEKRVPYKIVAGDNGDAWVEINGKKYASKVQNNYQKLLTA